MRIAVFGAGGVGGYLGARLQAAAEDVAYIARGRHLAALRDHGLTLRSAAGDLHLWPVTATDRPEAIGPVDYVLFTVKLFDLDSGARTIQPLIGPETTVITFQNGVDSVEVLGAAVGPERMMGGTTYIGAVIAEPGVIRHTGTLARFLIGEIDGRLSPRAAAFRDACVRAGIDMTLTDRIQAAIWEKFILLAANSGVTSLARLPVGRLRAHPASRALMGEAMAEVAAVARAKGVALPDDIAARQLALMDTLPAEMRSSMEQDLERGNRLELPWLSGAVVRLGEQFGVATPVHRVICGALGPHADGVPG